MLETFSEWKAKLAAADLRLRTDQSEPDSYYEWLAKQEELTEHETRQVELWHQRINDELDSPIDRATVRLLIAERKDLLEQVQEISDSIIRVGGGTADHRVRTLIRNIEGD